MSSCYSLPGETEDLIGIVNELQDKLFASGNNLDISLPQIVVVGCQSAGKSSVLENIVGREFLPRGSGVVTRRPTVVQLLQCEEDYAVFLHNPDKRYTDFKDVKAEIAAETNRDPGPIGFSSVPIFLQIYSPKVLKLTLVDLPGLIRVTVDNQSEDSVGEVRKMVLQYITQEKCLILAVSPANQDIANSDALEIAKTVDPKRIRTIGVLTKLDLMDEGTDAREILENKKIPLKRGYFGVLNRSQKDIENEKDIEYCLKKEEKFFSSSPCYKHMAHRMGTPFLKKKLTEDLHAHIREYLPTVEKELTDKLRSLEKQLKEFTLELGSKNLDPSGMHFYLVKLVQKFIDQFQTEIFGFSEQVDVDNLSAGAIINYELYKNIEEHLKLPRIPDEKQLVIIMANVHGIRNCLSLPSLALEIAAKELLIQYSAPLDFLVDKIGDILLFQVQKLAEKLDPYPNLKTKVITFVRNKISDGAFETKETIQKHLQADIYFVNTYHQDLKFTYPVDAKIDAVFPMKLWDTRNKPKETSTSFSFATPAQTSKIDHSEQNAIDMISSNESAKSASVFLQKAVEQYLSIKLRHIKDIASKYILFFLVKKVVDFVKTGLLQSILEATNNECLLKDCENDFQRMREIESTCKSLDDALNSLKSF